MDTSKEAYDALQERVNRLEAERTQYESAGMELPRRLRSDLAEYRISLEEMRKAGHRATVEAAERARRENKSRRLRERVEAYWRRIAEAPPVDPGEIRTEREDLGVTQQMLAQFSGVSRGTICRIERGGNYEPRPCNTSPQDWRRLGVAA